MTCTKDFNSSNIVLIKFGYLIIYDVINLKQNLLNDCSSFSYLAEIILAEIVAKSLNCCLFVCEAAILVLFYSVQTTSTQFNANEVSSSINKLIFNLL